MSPTVKIAIGWGIFGLIATCIGGIFFLINVAFEQGFVIVVPSFLGENGFQENSPESTAVSLPDPVTSLPGQPNIDPSSPEEMLIPLQVEIDSRRGWQSAGLWVEQDTKLTIEVIAGEWNYWPESSPDNAGQGWSYICANVIPASQCVEPLPDFPAGALIGRIGNQVFGIGSSATVVAQQSGRLSLRINDADHALYDNRGKLQVRVMLQAAD
jgi:hypothetical protein